MTGRLVDWMIATRTFCYVSQDWLTAVSPHEPRGGAVNPRVRPSDEDGDRRRVDGGEGEQRRQPSRAPGERRRVEAQQQHGEREVAQLEERRRHERLVRVRVRARARARV